MVDKENYRKEIINYLAFPIFAKPTNLSSGKYAKILKNEMELTTFCDGLKEADSFELDEYISGALFHIDSIVKNNTIILAQVNRYLNPMFDFTFGKPTGSILLNESDPDFKIFFDFNQKILSSFKKIPDGVTHMEAFKTLDNRLIFVEVAARPPGGLLKQCYKEYTRSV